MHCAPDKAHLIGEVAAGLAHREVHMDTRAFNHRQFALHAFRGQSMDFLASGFE